MLITNIRLLIENKIDMNEDEKKEFEEFLKWKKEKGNLTDNNLSKNDVVIEQARHNNHSGWKPGCGLGCLSVIILFIIFALASNGGGTKEDKNVVDESEASIISETFLKNLMKFPDDVIIDKSSRKVISEPENVFKVTGHLKANNTFGQAIPYTYNIRLKYNGGDWSEFRGGQPINWSFLGGNLYNEATQEFTELE